MIWPPLRALSQIAISVPTQVAKNKGAATEDRLGNRRVPATRILKWAEIIGCEPGELRPDLANKQ